MAKRERPLLSMRIVLTNQFIISQVKEMAAEKDLAERVICHQIIVQEIRRIHKEKTTTQKQLP